jgi:hypothetical protein
MDAALPDKHTRILCDTFKRREAGILAQLRTGMARLNDKSTRLERQNLTNVHVAKQGKRSSTSFSDARDGTHTVHKC